MTQIDVRLINHRTGALRRIIAPSEILALRYSRKLNDVGVVVLSCAYSDALWNDYALDDFIEVYVTHPTTGLLAKEETYLLRSREVYIEGRVEQLAFTGVSLNDIIRRRLVEPTIGTGGYITKAGDAVTVLAAFADEQLVNPLDSAREIPLLTITTSGTGTQPIGGRLRFENLLDEMQRLAEAGGIDFELRRTTGRNLELFIGRIGTDKSYATNYPLNPSTVFNPLRGNMLNPKYVEDRQNEKTFAYVLGEGEGANQFVYALAGAGTVDSNYNRIEDKTTQRKGEANQLSQTEQSITAAVNLIDDNKAKRQFTFDVPTGDAGGAVYGVDWVLGDTVTASWRSISQTLRITEIETDIGARGQFDRKVTLKERNI